MLPIRPLHPWNGIPSSMPLASTSNFVRRP